MSRARIKAIVRQFAENGIKLLLEDPRNVRDLLVIREAAMVDLIDFDHMTRLPTSFVQRDFRHVEADVVLHAPLRRVGKQQPRQVVTVYILIEHQSEPDAMMVFRVLEYVVQIYKAQTRDWHRRHKSFAGLRLHPVLPVVFYTGTRRWEAVGRVADLIDMGEHFTRMIPDMAPLFLNLSAIPPGHLESAGGFFGWVLRLIQDRHARPAEFQELLRRALRNTWRLWLPPSACGGWNCFPMCTRWSIMKETRPNMARCKRKSKPLFGRINFGGRSLPWEERSLTN